MSVLELDRVSVRYLRGRSLFYAVRDVSLDLGEGETLALVGESGSGKSTLARAAVGLASLSSGVISIAGRPLRTRGPRPIGMVFQDPLGSLDPQMSIGAAIDEVLRIHGKRNGDNRKVEALLESVGLPATAAQLRPRQLSGGQQQRAAIARALAAEPRVLILDEPVSALDVSIRAQILRLLANLQERLGIAYLFIAHDLAVVHQLANRVAVMYRGRIVELADAPDFFAQPLHPYATALLEAVPSLRRTKPSPAQTAETTAPALDGCVYAHRCPWAEGPSFEFQPRLEQAGDAHLVACHHWRRIAATMPR
ncbi:MAG: ABC transporter ATP-binding protein [Gaiellaceae bacterium]